MSVYLTDSHLTRYGVLREKININIIENNYDRANSIIYGQGNLTVSPIETLQIALIISIQWLLILLESHVIISGFKSIYFDFVV